ncbi:MAG: triose-phosphate isomerase [Chloroflexi bacterium]|nr:triose-phosphate isomerase [Chloroflexota bacterium]
MDRPAPAPGRDAGDRGGGRLSAEPRPRIRPPVFEVGLKGYAWGAAAVRLAVAADRLAVELDVSIVFDPQAVDIPAVAAATSRILVFAQHVDALPPGRGVGAVLAEAVREAGAVGTLLNHSERRLSPAELEASIERARAAGLATLVFADSPAEAEAFARLGPDIVLAEPPELIASGRSVGSVMAGFVAEAVAAVKGVDPRILVMSGAGVNGPADVETVMRLGLDGTGSSSGVLRAADPVAMLRAMLEATARTWQDLHPDRQA